MTTETTTQPGDVRELLPHPFEAEILRRCDALCIPRHQAEIAAREAVPTCHAIGDLVVKTFGRSGLSVSTTFDDFAVYHSGTVRRTVRGRIVDTPADMRAA